MKILRKYILKEIIIMFLFSLLVFTFTLVIGNLIQLAELVISKGVDIKLVGTLFLYLIPFLLSYTIPMSMLTSILIVFGRLSSDNEITAMRASGVNLYKLTIPLIITGFIFSLISVVLNNAMIPKMHFESRKIVKNIGVKMPSAYLEAGSFIKSFRGYIIYIQDIEKNKLKGIRIYQIQENRPTRTIIAEKGEFIPLDAQNAIKLKLTNGTSDEQNQKNPMEFYKLNFKNYFVTLNIGDANTGAENIQKKPKEMNFQEIRDEVKKLGIHHIDAPSLVTELHRKISISFASLVFVILGIPLGIYVKRGEKTTQFAIALCVIVVYYLLMAGSIALSLKNIGHPALWMYLPNITLACLGIILFKRTLEH